MDVISVLNPSLVEDPMYLWGRRRIDFILVSQGALLAAVKGGHHLFNQHVVSDHKGVYVYFNARELFDVGSMDQTHFAFRRLVLSRRDIVRKYMDKLENLYVEHNI